MFDSPVLEIFAKKIERLTQESASLQSQMEALRQQERSDRPL